MSGSKLSKVGVRVYKCPIGNQYYYGLRLYDLDKGEKPFVDEEWSRLQETENSVPVPEGHSVVGVYGYISDSTHI